MRTEDFKRIILKMFKGKEFHGYEAHKRLASEDVKIEISRLYRILNEMLKEGLLESRWERSQLGPKMRLYRLSKKGGKVLDKILLDAIETVHYFYDKYLLELPPEANAFNSICNLLISNLKERDSIVYVTNQYSPPNEEVLRSLRREVPEAKIYLVKPKPVTVDLKLDNLVLLDGTYSSIPLRNMYADLLIVSGIPKEEYLEKCLKEMLRVLKKSGKFAILMQTVQVQKYEDPLTIGSFIEKYEYETEEGGEHVDQKIIEELLKRFFQNVEKRQIVHITIFSASEPHLSSDDKKK